jgi:hypothetical protein
MKTKCFEIKNVLMYVVGMILLTGGFVNFGLACCNPPPVCPPCYAPGANCGCRQVGVPCGPGCCVGDAVCNNNTCCLPGWTGHGWDYYGGLWYPRCCPPSRPEFCSSPDGWWDCCQQCCGSLPGDIGCCWAVDICCYDHEIGHYCRLPCQEEDILPSPCRKSLELPNSCEFCLMAGEGVSCLSYTYLEYTDFVPKICRHGCHTIPVWEPCYKIRQCTGMLQTSSMCVECEGDIVCAGCDFSDYICFCGGDLSPGCEAIVEGCEIIFSCFNCTKGGAVIDTIPAGSCECHNY